MSSEVIPAAAEGLQEHTYNTLIEMWLDNFLTNLPSIRQGKKLEDIPKKTKEPIICVAAGPSLKRFNHLRMLKEWNHPILCCDRILNMALQEKLKPYAVATVDGSPAIYKFYNHPIIKKQSHIMGIFTTIISPNIPQSWRGPIYWYLSVMDEVLTEKGVNKKTVTYVLHYLANSASLISTMGNVGGFLVNLAIGLEADPIILVGYDFAEYVKYKDQTSYFKALTNMFMLKYKKKKIARDKAADLMQVEVNPDFIAEFDDMPYFKKGEQVRYLTNPVWKAYRNALGKLIINSKSHIIQSTGNGSLHSHAEWEADNTKYTLRNCKNFEAIPLEKVLDKYA